MSGSSKNASACCTPTAARSYTPPATSPQQNPLQKTADAVNIPGGNGLIGTQYEGMQGDGEGPLRNTRITPFKMGSTTVTQAQFAQFAAATGYVTEAERFGWSFVFWSDVPKAVGATQAVQATQWWRKVDGANWRDIHGPDTGAPTDHPVAHVSWSDAQAYAAWVGGRLPTEAEWEHAARGGLRDVPFPWGMEDPTDAGPYRCNIWQGKFPEHNTAADGFSGSAPARSFSPNGYGLYNMVGNVWEWTAQPFVVKSLKKQTRARLQTMRGFKLLKGGSALCHRSYCYRYRIAARTGNSPDSTTTHQGFRVVWDC